MDESQKFFKELKDLYNNLLENFKEDFNSIKESFYDKKNEIVSEKKYTVTLPVSEINVTEKIECINDEMFVTFVVKCGLKVYSTKIYLGTTLDSDLKKELRQCVLNAVYQCLQQEPGTIQRMDEGKVVEIFELNHRN